MTLLANSISPLVFLPGLLPLAVLLSLPATMLVSFIERPFYTRAGVVHHTIWYSMQANFLSLLAGVAALPLLAPVAVGFPPCGSLPAVVVSIFVEGLYLDRKTENRGTLRWRWVVLANSISSVILMLLPSICEALTDSGSPLILRPRAQMFDWPAWVAAGACLGLFIFSFFAPRLFRQSATSLEIPVV